jgi:hypothetical protein
MGRTAEAKEVLEKAIVIALATRRIHPRACQCSVNPPRPFTRSLPLFQLGESIAGEPDQLG